MQVQFKTIFVALSLYASYRPIQLSSRSTDSILILIKFKDIAFTSLATDVCLRVNLPFHLRLYQRRHVYRPTSLPSSIEYKTESCQCRDPSLPQQPSHVPGDVRRNFRLQNVSHIYFDLLTKQTKKGQRFIINVSLYSPYISVDIVDFSLCTWHFFTIKLKKKTENQKRQFLYTAVEFYTKVRSYIVSNHSF